MKPMTSDFAVKFAPVADEGALVLGENVRFTVLTERLVRLEYSPNSIFEDRPSQAFWVRRISVPEFESRQVQGRIEIETSSLLLEYDAGIGFTADSLRITLKESGVTWCYGDEDPFNLNGTARTLDNVDGALTLEEGLLSRSGWVVYDDTPRLIFNEDGWLEPRQAAEGYRDLMFFGYGQDYTACLRDFTLVAGPAPMIPRWVLGNWWSRYWAYADKELLGVMDEFIAHQVPLSVCIVDMDWHIVDTGNASSGWTGYTWNKALFPDPAAFIAELHKRGLKTALNLHPAEGVHAHEAQYEAMCSRLGVDPAKKEPIPFDIADPQFARAYFDLLHYPKEKDGVDFWWMDWQQGKESSLSGLDPLSWLNHLHFHDLGRNGDKRPFIFSRWGGLGNHRTPIGFSGDAVITWESLAFQPYFTSTAANVNYGWWSHDIGGHMSGYEEPQLYARWVQYGVFSPILRLHSTNNPFHERRPWGWDAETERVTSAALRLRHRLIPYIYSMAWRNHTESLPMIRPMYHEYARDEQAYHCPDQYTFGSELIAAPFLEPLDADTRLSRQVVWLPPGMWYGFFDGLAYEGDGWHAVYGSLDDIPVFARAGAIVPLGPEVGWGGIENPEKLVVHLFPGADNEFKLYEDDGLQSYSLTPLVQTWSEEGWQASIGPVEGDTAHLPAARTYELLFRGVGEEATVSAKSNGEPLDVLVHYLQKESGLRVMAVGIMPGDIVTVDITHAQKMGIDPRLARCRKVVRSSRMESYTKLALDGELPKIVGDPSLLENYQLLLTKSQLRALLEIITGAGCHQRNQRRKKGEAIILWNNQGARDMHYKFAALDINKHPQTEKGVLPKFAVLNRDDKSLTFHRSSQLAQGRIGIDNWLNSLLERIRPQQVDDLNAAIRFNIKGENGRTATFVLQDGRGTLFEGDQERVNASISAERADWLAMINGEETPENLFFQGKIELGGDMELVLKFITVFDIVPSGKFQRNQWQLFIDYPDLLRIEIP